MEENNPFVTEDAEYLGHATQKVSDMWWIQWKGHSYLMLPMN